MNVFKSWLTRRKRQRLSKRIVSDVVSGLAESDRVTAEVSIFIDSDQIKEVVVAAAAISGAGIQANVCRGLVVFCSEESDDIFGARGDYL